MFDAKYTSTYSFFFVIFFLLVFRFSFSFSIFTFMFLNFFFLFFLFSSLFSFSFFFFPPFFRFSPHFTCVCCQISGLPPDVVEVKCGASFCLALTAKVSRLFCHAPDYFRCGVCSSQRPALLMDEAFLCSFICTERPLSR